MNPDPINPYEPATIPTGTRSPVSRSLNRPLTALVGVFACGAVSVVAGELLSLIALFPPMNHWTNLDGEFDGLILVGMPMLAGGCGALAGLSLGMLYPRRYGRLVSGLIGSLPALWFCWQNYGAEDSPVSVIAVSSIMVIATVVAVLFTHRMMRSIDRRRSTETSATESRRSGCAGRVMVATSFLLAIFSVAYDVWLWRGIASDDNVSHEFTLIGAFGLGMVAVAVNVAVGAAYPHRKLVAIVGGLAAFTGTLGVICFWYWQLTH